MVHFDVYLLTVGVDTLSLEKKNLTCWDPDPVLASILGIVCTLFTDNCKRNKIMRVGGTVGVCIQQLTASFVTGISW